MDEKTYKLCIGELIGIFYDVRDNYPYGVSRNLEGPPYDCEDKCKKFIERVKRLNEEKGIDIEVRPSYGISKWSFVFPKEVVKDMSKDVVGHYCSEVYVPERGLWVPVDATFDIGLKGKYPGIVVNDWNGYADTVRVFPPTKIYTPKRSLKEFEEVTTEEDYAKLWKKDGKGYNALNQYLEKLRQMPIQLFG